MDQGMRKETLQGVRLRGDFLPISGDTVEGL